MIESALRESEGRVFGPSGAAAKLGISRSALESKIRSLRINKNRFKSRAGMPAGRSWFESVSITPLRASVSRPGPTERSVMTPFNFHPSKMPCAARRKES